MSIDSIPRVFNQLKMESITQNRRIITGLAVVAGGIPLLSYSVSCYRGWLKLGKGGPPYNVIGWLANTLMHLIARSDTKIPAPYKLEKLETIYGPAGKESYFDDKLPPTQRAGARPDVPTYVAPQRQMTDQVTTEMLHRMEIFLATLATLNPDVFQIKPSKLEGPAHDALWLADHVAIPAYLKGIRGEFMHVHGEGSTHLVLSLTDSAKVIESGWAERHKLSGAIVGGVPITYVLVYAPRNNEEYMIWKAIVRAAARFNAAGANGPLVRMPRK
ncbi:hypothetical protein BJ170DRAFT_423522 [Xylariales sp. AK1849]|nr:hypothetical protein BJ170DRAFT_423522 [Xylariales sp. AK1849]